MHTEGVLQEVVAEDQGKLYVRGFTS